MSYLPYFGPHFVQDEFKSGCLLCVFYLYALRGQSLRGKRSKTILPEVKSCKISNSSQTELLQKITLMKIQVLVERILM